MPVDEQGGVESTIGPEPAPGFPYEFDAAAREKASRFARVRIALSLYTPDLVLLPVMFMLLVTGLSATIRDRAFAIDPGTGSPLFDEALRVTIYAFVLASIAWLAILVPGPLNPSDLGRAHGRRRDPAVRLWARIGMLPPLCFAATGFTLVFYAVVWTTPGWWLLLAALLAVFTAIYFSRLLGHHRAKADFSSVPSRLRERFAAIARLGGPVNVTVATSRAKKPTAFTFGFGRSQTVVLSQEILERMHPRELDVVMAHEIGHVANHDFVRKVMMQSTLALLGLGLLAFLLETIVGRFGILSRWDVASLPLVFLYLRLGSFVLAPVSNYHSQRRELAADRFALSLLGDPVAYISAQKRLADMDLAESHHGFFSRMLSTHPSVKERLELAHQIPDPPSGPGPR